MEVDVMEHSRGRGTAVVTGASRGIGPHIARVLASDGYPVVLAARTGDALERVAAGIRRAGGTAHAVVADLAVPGDRDRLIRAAEVELGAVEVLVNNAASGPVFGFHEQGAAEVTELLELNLHAPIELTRLVLPGMLRRERGDVVNVATLAAKLPMPYMAMYSATKAGLAQFTAALALEHEGSGVRFATVFPGAVSEEGMAVRTARETGVEFPDGGAVKPEVVAQAVMDAIQGDKTEILVGQGARLVTRHPRLGYFLMRKAGTFDSLRAAAGRYQQLSRAA